MDDPLFMGIVKGVACTGNDFHHPAHGQEAVFLTKFLKGGPVNAFQGQIAEILKHISVIDGDNIGVIQPPRRLSLHKKPLQGLVRTGTGHLNGHISLYMAIPSQVDNSCAPLTQLPFNVVSADRG